MNQFNNLPPEIIEFIFKKVYFNDLINLRTVDRRFKQICDQFKIKQLNVTDCNKRYLFWFYTNDSTYSNKENQTMISRFLNYKLTFKLDKHLRRLSIWLDEDFNISILNEFKLLEQLQMCTNKLNDNYELNLENLKICCIKIGANLHFKLTLNTKKLFAFKSSKFTRLAQFNRLAQSTRLDQFIFNYPEKIRFYEKDEDYDYNEIKEFIYVIL